MESTRFGYLQIADDLEREAEQTLDEHRAAELRRLAANWREKYFAPPIDCDRSQVVQYTHGRYRPTPAAR